MSAVEAWGRRGLTFVCHLVTPPRIQTDLCGEHTSVQGMSRSSATSRDDATCSKLRHVISAWWCGITVWWGGHPPRFPAYTCWSSRIRKANGIAAPTHLIRIATVAPGLAAAAALVAALR